MRKLESEVVPAGKIAAVLLDGVAPSTPSTPSIEVRPLALPMLRAVDAPPAKFTVVAVVLSSAKVVEPVVSEVVSAGLVPNTATPVPVSSLNAPDKFALVKLPSEVAFPELVTAPVKFALVVTVPAVKDAAVPVSPVPAPVKLVDDRTPVLGLNVSFVLVTFAGKLPVLAVAHRGNIVAFVAVSLVMPTFVAFVAVVVVVELSAVAACRFATSVVEATVSGAVPVATVEVNVVAVNAPVPELNVSVDASDSCPPEPANVTLPEVRALAKTFTVSISVAAVSESTSTAFVCP